MAVGLIIEKLAEQLVTSLLKSGLSRVINQKTSESDFRDQVESHIRQVSNWAQQVQFFGMSTPHSTDSQTIPLSFHTIPRKFGSKNDAKHKETEEQILCSGGHILMLGDPGCGKTTSLKRLAWQVLTSEPRGETDTTQFPIVLRLRDMDLSKPLFPNLADQLGIPYDVRSTPQTVSYLCDGTELSYVLPKLIDPCHAMIMLDGLDEVPQELSQSLLKDVQLLVSRLSCSRLIATSRCGAFRQAIEGTRVLEVLPLDFHQTDALVRIWLPEPEEFYELLSKVPYRDVIERPLLVAQLLFLYLREGYLPEKPSTIYRKLVRLLLLDWDAERGVTRASAYATFDPDRKAEFLSELSYHLTVRCKSRVFTRELLLAAYIEIHQSFELPSGAAEDIVSELETHSGLIVQAGFERYEFAHASLQEYLCADYLVRSPVTPVYLEYVVDYPAPVAVAAALSSNPSEWLATLLLNVDTGKLYEKGWAARILLERLVLERPVFRPSIALGVVFLKLLYDAGLSDVGLLPEAFRLPGVKTSLLACLPHYIIIGPQTSAEMYYLELSKDFDNITELSVSDRLEMTREDLAMLTRSASANMFWQDSELESRPCVIKDGQVRVTIGNAHVSPFGRYEKLLTGRERR
jgi:DNA polymerase III delta prime subunit